MHIRTVVGALAALAAGPAAAADAQVAGEWTVVGQIVAGEQIAVARPVCTLRQDGAALSGACEGPNSTGPLTGKVSGQHVSFAWRHMPRSDVGLSGFSSFEGELGSDGAIQGSWTYEALPGATGAFRAERK